jgi:zinc/manganese transport system ATP-binding protein
MKATAPTLSFHNLTLGYGRHPAVHHITGEVARGELLAIVGPNGAGKSTLLKGIVGELKPFSGRLGIDGLTKRDKAYLPQVIEIDRSCPN